MDWILFLHVFTVLNKLLLFPLFWFKKNNSDANRLLALLILLPAIPVVADFFIYTGLLKDYPYILFLYQIFINVFGPVYYFYCMTMIGRPFRFSRKKLLHLLPSVFPLFLWADYLLLGPEEKSEYLSFFLQPGYLTWRMMAVSITPMLFSLPYMLVAARNVYRYTSSAKDVFTNLETVKIGYVKEFMCITIGEALFLLTLFAFVPTRVIETIWVPVLGNLMYFYIIYKSYNYSIVFSEKDYAAYQQLYVPLGRYIEEASSPKYMGSSLPLPKVGHYAKQLNDGFEKQQWHLDSELNLSVLSEKTKIPLHYISQVINQEFGRNFFDYVNSYRVEELKSKLLQQEFNHLKLEELAYLCGFNSKAAYQRAFKKHTGMTPTQYRNMHLDSLPEAV